MRAYRPWFGEMPFDPWKAAIAVLINAIALTMLFRRQIAGIPNTDETRRAAEQLFRANEAKIKDQTKATVRCIPFDQPNSPGKCIFTGAETGTEVLFAQAY